LRETLERLLDHHQQEFQGIALPVVARANHPSSAPPRPLSPSERAARDGRRQRKVARFEQTRAMHELGMSAREISQQLGISRTTVGRYLHADQFPEQTQHGQKPSRLDPFTEYLQFRWDEGCHNAQQLHGEIQARGYRGTRKLVARWAQSRRKDPAPSTPKRYIDRQPRSEGETEQTNSSLHSGRRQHRPSSRRLSWLLVREPQTLSPAEHDTLSQIQDACADVRTAYPLAQEFGAIVRRHAPADAFPGWLDRTLASAIPALVAFGIGLRRDEAAVRAALTSLWSNGQTEGQVTKLKQLKRQMYGRANLDLLRRRWIESG
jgi:transposase